MFEKTSVWANLNDWVNQNKGVIKTAGLTGPKDKVFVIASLLSERCGLRVEASDMIDLNKRVAERLGGVKKPTDLQLTAVIADWLDTKKAIRATAELKKIVSSAINLAGSRSIGPVEFAVRDGIRLQANSIKEAQRAVDTFQKYLEESKTTPNTFGRSAHFQHTPSIKMEREGNVKLAKGLKKQDVDRCRQCVYFNSDPGVTHLNKCEKCKHFGLGGVLDSFTPRSVGKYVGTEQYPEPVKASDNSIKKFALQGDIVVAEGEITKKAMVGPKIDASDLQSDEWRFAYGQYILADVQGPQLHDQSWTLWLKPGGMVELVLRNDMTGPEDSYTMDTLQITPEQVTSLIEKARSTVEAGDEQQFEEVIAALEGRVNEEDI